MAKFVVIPPAAFLLGVLWAGWLDYRYGEQVSPDATIPSGFALFTGWFLILVAALIVLVAA